MILQRLPSVSSVATASHPAAEPSSDTAMRCSAAEAPADASLCTASTGSAAYGITDRPAAGSRGIQAFPAPVALPLNLTATADPLENLA